MIAKRPITRHINSGICGATPRTGERLHAMLHGELSTGEVTCHSRSFI